MSPPQSSPINLAALLSSSTRIISAHSRHFLALSVLFLLPLAFLATISSTLRSLLHLASHHHLQTLTLLNLSSNTTTTTEILFPAIFSLTSLILSAAAIGSISFSVFHGFFGRPVKLASSLYHLIYTFPKLLATSIAAGLIQLVVSTGFLALLISILKASQFLGFEIGLNSVPFIIVGIVIAINLLSVLIYLNVNWILSSVIVVIEGSWGLTPLRRSAYLVKEMRSVALSLLSFFGFFVAFLAWLGAGDGVAFTEMSTSWVEGLGFVARTVAVTALLTVFMFNGLAANVVLYLYAKAGKGELAGEIAEEFAREYVSLPFDEGKVPHYVSVVHAV